MKPLLLLPFSIVLAACNAQSPAVAAPDSVPEAPSPAVVDALPLQAGFFIRDGTPCGEASNATLLLHIDGGIGGSQEICEFKRIEQHDDTTFVVTQECGDIRGGEREADELTYTVSSPTAFRVVHNEYGWEYTAEYCPQSALPEPWRSNDIGG